MKQIDENKTCHIRHINARNTAYLISYLEFVLKISSMYTIWASRIQEFEIDKWWGECR